MYLNWLLGLGDCFWLLDLVVLVCYFAVWVVCWVVLLLVACDWLLWLTCLFTVGWVSWCLFGLACVCLAGCLVWCFKFAVGLVLFIALRCVCFCGWF